MRALPDVLTRPHELAGRLSPDGAVVLSGAWAGGGAIVADSPVAVAEGADPFTVLDEAIGDPFDAPSGTVGGGWFGWFGFAAGDRAPDGPAPDRPGRPAGPDRLPDVHLAFHPNVLRYDAASGRWWDEALLGVISDAELEKRRSDLGRRLRAAAGWRPGRIAVRDFTSMSTRAQYEAAVRRCVAFIRAGEIYQANVCLALGAAVIGDSAADLAAGLYSHLIGRLHPRYGALLGGPTGALVSASPELFLARRGRRVLSSPIKGTRPRPEGGEPAGRPAAGLRDSAKDRAENVMIVDLVRNDLARIAVTGSVHVPALLRLEPHPGVWHLVSDVAAVLRADVTDADLLRATFPPGSVTGAPKLRALDVIRALEPVPRGVYTGAFGYRSPVAGLEFSVAIRTFEVVGDRLWLGVGAGITAGSDPAEEWFECFDKAAPLVAALNARLDVPGHRRSKCPGGSR